MSLAHDLITARRDRLARFAAVAVPDHGIDLRRRFKVVPEPEPVEQPKPIEPEPEPIMAEPSEPKLTERPPGFLKLQVKDIAKAVAKHYGVGLNDLYSARRTVRVVNPRHVAIWVVYKVMACTMPEIGRRFGGRDHTTILHAIRRIDAKRLCDVKLQAELDYFVSLFKDKDDDLVDG